MLNKIGETAGSAARTTAASHLAKPSPDRMKRVYANGHELLPITGGAAMVRNQEELRSAIFAARHCVMISAPECGFGRDLDAMIDFYWESDEAICTGHLKTRTYPGDWIYFCFSDAKNAEDFAARFGGQILPR